MNYPGEISNFLFPGVSTAKDCKNQGTFHPFSQRGFVFSREQSFLPLFNRAGKAFM